MESKKKTTTSRVIFKSIATSCCRLLTFVFFLVIVSVGTELVHYFTTWSELNTDFDWNWSYSPQQDDLVPFNSSYEKYTILMDGHTHVDSLNEEETILWHLGNGYNAMIVTEHNDVNTSLKVQEIARKNMPTKCL